MSEAENIILRSYERVWQEASAEPVGPPSSFHLVGVALGLNPTDLKEYVEAATRTVQRAAADLGEQALRQAVEMAVLTSLLTGLAAGQEMAGLTDLECEPWWEPRQQGELTPYYLGRILQELELDDMARRARAGHFDDYQAPDDVADGLELIHLVEELTLNLWRSDTEGAGRIQAVINAVREGEFDATKEESDRWAASKSGQDAFKRLYEGK